MEIKKVTDAAFKKYGCVISHVDVAELVAALKETPIPADVVYEPSVESLEKLPVKEELSSVIYGEMPIQIGYCNGHNKKLNALEYHRDSEINIAAEDAVLMLGSLQDVKADFTYDTSKVEAFLVPAGTAVEIYATTLHYAPCHVEDGGFQVAVVLPKGTNYELKTTHAKVENGKAPSEDALLAAVNKWLIGHAEGGLPEGSFLGLKGENLSL
ncbi:putative uncharacterized protein [Clostridium sp. CAG:510]|nr:putative uncharacterized protein [Clostridium sp. CAG:510]